MLLPEHLDALLRGVPWRDPRPIWQIADGYYPLDRTRPRGERWRLDRTPWWRQIMDDFRRAAVREIVIMAASQTGKTAGALVILAWLVRYAPGPVLWLTGNDQLARDASLERILPTLQSCPDTKDLLLDNRCDTTIWKIRTLTCTIDISGAQSAMALEQNPYAYVFGDEVRQWPAGHLAKVEKRQRTYEHAKRLLFSTPAYCGDEFDQRYRAGSCSEWKFPCMECGKPVDMVLNFETIAIHCAHCGHAHVDNPTVRQHILRAGAWHDTNPGAPASVRSYQWSALLPPNIAWSTIARERDMAREQARAGNVHAEMVFECETLGKPFEPKPAQTSVEIIEQRRRPYHRRDAWPDQTVVFAGADVQSDVIYWAVRAWSIGARSRLIDYGRVGDFAGLHDLLSKLVPSPKFVFIDSGYKTAAVYSACLRFGWKPIKGLRSASFEWPDGVRRAWRIQHVDLAVATGGRTHQTLKLWEYSADDLKNLLWSMISGEIGDWTIPDDTEAEYIAQLTAEQNEPVLVNGIPTGRYVWRRVSRDNHWLDCECMALVGALDYSLRMPGHSVMTHQLTSPQNTLHSEQDEPKSVHAG